MRILLDSSAYRQASRHARRNRPIERVVTQRLEKRDQVFVIIVDAAELPNQRIELLAADVRVAIVSAPGIDIVVEVEDVFERREQPVVHVGGRENKVSERSGAKRVSILSALI